MKTAKNVISDTQFLAKVKSYDKDGVTNSLHTKVRKYVTMDTFTPEAVGKVSIAAAALCTLVNAIYIYSNVFREVAPKKAKLKAAKQSLAEKQKVLAEEKIKKISFYLISDRGGVNHLLS